MERDSPDDHAAATVRESPARGTSASSTMVGYICLMRA
ncbi:hypothetical protein AKJ08_0541 [Vulgatibacter incomptus]|uniref:Uncharacterized protein n=1 Tax=Vulgatibacter incomptus TaxID=1391653 RepID=A0A0K1PAL4_9BACT|nr:hypothetical protein AKJ08_0541 [Vulgatibacter incomptus]